MAEIGVKIKLEGAPQYTESMRNVTAQTKLYQAQVKSLQTTLSSGSAYSKSIAMQKALAQQLEAQKNKHQLLESELQKEIEKHDEFSTRAISLRTQLQNLDAQISRTESDLKSMGGQFGAVGAQLKEVGDKLQSIGNSVSAVGQKMTKAITVPVLGLGAAAVKTAASFDSAMSEVAATMGFTVEQLNDSTSDASKTMQQLSDFAKEMGKTTAFSASEAAQGLNYMALAGYSAEDAMKMMPTVLNLAAAGGIELAQASDMVTDAQSALGLSMEETATLVDQMAKAASSGNTSVAQLGEAMLTIGATAQGMKGGTAELAKALTVLADNSIKGSEGGTKLRNIMLSLQDAAKDGAVDFGNFSVEVYDSEGNLRGITDIMQDLSSNMQGMSKEAKDAIMSGIFNKQDLAAANALVATSSERFDELEKSISGAAGSAEEMAKVKLNNLEGQITLLKSALEGVAIDLGTILMPYIQKFVEKIQQLVDWFGNLDKGTQEMIVKAALAAAAIGPLLTAGGKLVTGIGSISTGLGNIATKIGPLISSIGLAAPEILAIVAAVGALVAVFVNLFKTNENFRSSVMGIWDQIKLFTADLSTMFAGLFESISSLANALWEIFGDEIMIRIQTAFDLIKITIETIVTVIKAFIDMLVAIINGDWAAAWDNFALIFTTIWEALKNIAITILQAVVDIVKERVAIVKNVFTGLKTAIVTTFTNLKNAALQWGKDLIQNFIDGIKEKVELLKTTVSSIAQTVKDFLGFSVPKLGPLSDANNYGFDFMKLYAEGIDASKYLVKEAVADVASDMAAIANPLLDASEMYDAVRRGASDANMSVSIGDREFGRLLRDMGVQF